MKILFVHQNFPAQFVHLAPELARRGHEVVALASSKNTQQTTIRTVRYRHDLPTFSRAEYGLAAHFAEQTARGQLVARAATNLSDMGFVPDMVFGHSGWGETLFLPEVWPKARQLVYAEFFYQPRGQDVDFDPEFQHLDLDQAAWVRSRQGAQLLSMHAAHAAQTPTQWQAASFPAYLRHRISVIHDGIDTGWARPDAAATFAVPGRPEPFRAGDEVLTYVNRHLEPYRGMHIFLRSLPEILAARPKAEVVIVGSPGQGYGKPSPDGRSWKDRLTDEIRDRADLSRVHFVGHVDHARLLSLMQVSRVHAYLSYPFVLSWSMLEAMSAGALVVGSATPPVAEVIRHGENGLLVDFFDVPGWAKTLADCLARPADFAPLRVRARDDIIARYDLASVCLPRQVRFAEGGA